VPAASGHAPALAAAPATAARGETPRERRRQVLADARREHILAAAREAFFDLGLEGASLREIAKRAGYTAGAIYSYFASKEDVYATLLAESLERLNARVAGAAGTSPARGAGRSGAAAAADALRRSARALFDFYRENPRDLDLGFYLFHGMQPRGLTPLWNERLNSRLRDALRPQERALAALGFDGDAARSELTALFAHAVGLLLLSHTGRIRMFGRASEDLFARYLDGLVARAAARPPKRKRS
jgi:AcrR family transcriptional regulator